MSDIHRFVLTAKEMLALAEIIKAEYTKSRLGETAFADWVNNHHSPSFRKPITAHHIRTLRYSLDIPSNTRPQADSVGDCLALTARVQALEDQLNKLTGFLKVHGFKG